MPVGKDMRMKNVMLGWFQFQHEDGTTDSWTIDNVNITLSLDSTRGGNEGTASDSGGSSSSGWIYGVIAGVVVIVIVALIILAIVVVKRRAQKEKYEFHSPTKPTIQTEFRNPVFGTMEGSFEATGQNIYVDNDN